MQIQLIRNAMMKIHYAGKTILSDPMLSQVGEIISFAVKSRNPTVSLPVPIPEIIAGIDCVLISHTHPDHYDKPASRLLPRDVQMFCQPGDANKLARAGFTQVSTVDTDTIWENITIIRTGGKHGSSPLSAVMGKVSGFVLQAADEPTVYWVGDSIWCDIVSEVLETYKPEIIITHSGGAKFPGFKPIIMDGHQTLKVAAAMPTSRIIAIHMEALDHCGVSRQQLRQMADAAHIHPTRLLIPEDGETILL